MLRKSVALGGLPLNHESRRVNLFKPLMAVSILALAGAVTVGSAQAQGGRIADFPPGPVVVAPYNWSGLYVGGHVGYAWSDVDWSLGDVEFPPGLGVTDPQIAALRGIIPGFTHDTDGVIGGGHIGANAQFFRWVVGLEASFSVGDLEDSQTKEIAGVIPITINLGAASFDLTNTTFTNTAEIDGLFLATARLGYTWDRWLAYLKGGYASAEIETNQTVLGTADPGAPGAPGGLPFAFEAEASTSERHHGWTVGAGLEYALTHNFIFGVEYNYIDLGAETHRGRAEVVNLGPPETALDPVRFTANVDPDAIHTVMARLSLKFGREEPVALVEPLPPPLK